MFENFCSSYLIGLIDSQCMLRPLKVFKTRPLVPTRIWRCHKPANPSLDKVKRAARETSAAGCIVAAAMHAHTNSSYSASQIAGPLSEIRGRKAVYRRTQKTYESALQQTFVKITRPIITLSLTSSQSSCKIMVNQKMNDALEVLTDSCLPLSPLGFEDGAEFCTNCFSSPIPQF